MKLNDRLHVTVFGDSIGKGIFTDRGTLEILPANAVSLFEEGYGVKVENRSQYGQSIAKLLRRGVVESYIARLDPGAYNVVVIELGGNDADFDWKAVGKDPLAEHFPKMPIGEFSSAYGAIVSMLQKAGVKVITCTIVPISSERYLENVIARETDKERVLEFFHGDPDTIHRHQEMFNNEILKNSYARGVEVIDLRRKFLDTNQFGEMMCRDGIHPNARGHAAIYGAVREFIAS